VKTAIDTNVLLYIARGHPTYLEPALAALEAALATGVVVACPSVYAELAVNFEQGQETLDAYLGDLGVQVEPFTSETVRGNNMLHTIGGDTYASMHGEIVASASGAVG